MRTTVKRLAGYEIPIAPPKNTTCARCEKELEVHECNKVGSLRTHTTGNVIISWDWMCLNCFSVIQRGILNLDKTNEQNRTIKQHH